MMIVRGTVRPFLHWQRESEYTMICIVSVLYIFAALHEYL